ncbi:MAG: DeoR/GlpR transcriptional regulator, partial [Lachnospiraceae bacterium]|nr:DeoR/GlpR transcriptional regulator [Lachnospiraceae bacterium]
FNVRKKGNVAGKQRLADLAAGQIRDGDHIILDASSTSVFIAKAIKDKKNLTVLTNSIEIIIELSDMPDWNIICSGGSLKEGYLALVGPKALENLSSFNADKAFFSCKGIDIERGITDGNEMFTQVKQVMMHSAAKSILAADSTKFDKIAFSRLCDVKDMQTILMDRNPEERW